MSTFVVGCDRNSSNDSKVQNAISNALKKQGHKVEKLPIGPGYFANYDWHKNGKNPKGKIGVYIIADGITSIADHYDNPNGFKYVYFVIRGDLGRPKMNSRSDFEKNPIGKDYHGDCTSKSCSKLAGKNFPQMNKIVKSKCYIVFGTTANEMAKELINATGGGSETPKGDNSQNAKKIGQGGTIRDALQKLLTHWDGDVECYIRGDEVHVNKVREPDKYCSCVLEEGFNVFSDSVNVTDVNPNTVNYLEVVWKGGTIVIKDTKLIDRFGEVRMSVIANNEADVTKTTTKKKVKKKSSD